MRTWNCLCGAELFFHNTRCVACGRDVGLCDLCHQVHAVEAADETAGSQYVRGCTRNPQVILTRCRNGIENAICNGFRMVDQRDEANSDDRCTWCRLTVEHPTLDDEQTRARLQKLEAAKRRTLYVVEQIGLPIMFTADELPLGFRFLEQDDRGQVMTGHANGIITINLCEADSVHREATRVEFGEPHRTLVGHLRHELGHYYWQRLVEPAAEQLTRYREIFGDERDPSYADAMKRYYDRGSAIAWYGQYVSQYATMHSWEDFAESFNAYLDMRTVLATAAHFIHHDSIRRRGRINKPAVNDPFEQMIAEYARVGIVANEFNRDLGLLDLVPEVFTTKVVQKLRFIHQLCRPNTDVHSADFRTVDFSDGR